VTDFELVLPCLDEAQALPGVLGALPAGCSVLVVDNASSDGTPKLARGLGARVVYEPRRGYGAAVHTGLVHTRAAIVAFMDADGSIDPSVLPALVGAVAEGRADLSVGRRIPIARHAQPRHAAAANAVLAAVVRARGLPVHDIASIRVARRSELLALGITDRGSGYPLELLLRAAAAGWVVHETPVAYRPRAGGRSKVAGSLPGTLRAALDLARVVARHYRRPSAPGPRPRDARSAPQ
jgi:glycosyltransferase involved in cell wall biosynthesis